MNKLAKTTKRDVFEINRTIRTIDAVKVSNSWLSRFTTSKNDYFKQVHVLGDRAYLMLMSTRSSLKGMYITGSLDYKLDNLPNFIKRHIDFEVLSKQMETKDFRSFGAFFRDGKLINN